MNKKQIKQEIKIKTNYLLTNLNKMSMKKVYLILAAAVGMTITSCTTNDYLGDVNNDQAINDGSIKFGFKMQNLTRADIAGQAAAEKLNNNFYVVGTKADITETPAIPTASPTKVLVFDNYLVNYGINTAGTTESNTANWEYVGVTPDGTNYAKLGSYSAQTIKYWDYSVPQYDFLAFSTGSQKAVTGKTTATIASNEINVTAMNYGSTLAGNGTAYTFIIPSVDALKEAYISDITEVKKANFGKDVTLKFKNLGAKVRVALYETVPGYSVKNVKFYAVDKADASVDDLGVSTTSNATLISAADGGIPNKATIEVYFPHVGSASGPDGTNEADYNKASATVTPITIPESSDPGYAAALACYDKAPTFGTLAATKLVAKESAEAGDDNVFLGRSLPYATFAGDKDADFYETVFPVSNSSALTLRVDYTLVPIDGAAETINVYGAKAVVPATYTKWLPNYAYTYIFKISDNTNGWTSKTISDPQGLFPITFDAVVAEATDANAEQKTITTVATPTITTYQQNHDITKDEYSKATGKNVYVQVMNNKLSPATLLTDLDQNATGASTKKSLFYEITGVAKPTEALVMDALQNQSSVDGGTGAITGRNSVVLTPAAIDLDETTIVNGVDDNPIDLSAAGKTAMIDMSSTPAGTYAYVYDHSTAAKSLTDIYQPIDVSGGTVGSAGTTYYSLANSVIEAASATALNEAVDKTYLYFSVTTDGGATKTYSYVSVEGKAKLPAGLKKVLKSTVLANEVTGGTTAAANTFYFFKYINNDGKYAVKVIKIVSGL